MIREDNYVEKIENGQSTFIVLFNDEVIIDDNKFGVISLIENYDLLKNSTKTLKIYDKLIGRGAATLINQLDVEFIYAKTITKVALGLLENKCEVKYNVVVDNILNRDKSDLCPIEKIASTNSDVNVLYNNLKEFYLERGFISD